MDHYYTNNAQYDILDASAARKEETRDGKHPAHLHQLITVTRLCARSRG